MDNNKKTKEEDNLPGYPHYPAEDDITKSAEEIPLDMENIARNTNPNTTINSAGLPSGIKKEKESIDETVSESLDGPSESDVTAEDLQALGELGMKFLKIDLTVLLQATKIWIFPELNWMTPMRVQGMKMRKIITTAWEQIKID